MSMDVQEILVLKAKLQKHKETGYKTCQAILQNLKASNLNASQISETKISKTVKSLSDLKFENPDEEQKQTVEISNELIKIWKSLFSKKPPLKQKQSQQSLSQNSLNLSKQNSLKRSDSTTSNQPLPPKDIDYSLLPTYRMNGRSKAIKKFFEVLLTKDTSLNNNSIKDDEDLDFLEENVEEKETQILAAEQTAQIEGLIFDRIEKEAKKHGSQNLIERNYLQFMNTIINFIFKNPQVRKGIIDKTISPEQISNQDPEIFLSEKEKLELQKIKEEEAILKNPQFWANKKREFMKTCTDGERCRFCKKMVAYCESEKQTRSADEPMTRFMRCDNCDRNWRD